MNYEKVAYLVVYSSSLNADALSFTKYLPYATLASQNKLFKVRALRLWLAATAPCIILELHSDITGSYN
jgi:hypothetical protein